MKYVWLVALALAASCSKSNSEACCTSEADCTAVGLPMGSTCPSGQACSQHACITEECTSDGDCNDPTPVCASGLCVACDSTHGCAASAPVCAIDMSACSACGDSTECASFPDAPVCDTMSGGCVQCVSTADCASATPVCDRGACRACNADSDCASGACAVDGTCVDPTSIIYVAPAGVDAGACSQASPCATIAFAVGQTTFDRNQIVLASGTYATTATLFSPAAGALFLHGGGATLTPDDPTQPILTMATSATTISNLTITAPTSSAFTIVTTGGGIATMQAITLHDAPPLGIGGPVTAHDLTILDSTAAAIHMDFGGVLTLDRATIVGGTTGIEGVATSQGESEIHLTNVMVAATTGPGLDLSKTKGDVAFVTVAYAGTASPTGAQLACGGIVAISSSIFWASDATHLATTGTCMLSSTIAGPQAAFGAMNTDPMFVNPIASDFHLKPTSPAVDAVSSGPPDDFEGDARPQGAGYDIGADEVTP